MYGTHDLTLFILLICCCCAPLNILDFHRYNINRYLIHIVY